MIDCSSGTENRNYGIQRRTDSRNLTDLLAIILCITMVAAASFCYLWTRSRMVSLGYQQQQLRDMEESLLRDQANLILEEETLKAPKRIEYIARNELGLIPIQAGQLIIPEFREGSLEDPGAVALARPPRTDPPGRKLSAAN